MSEFHDCENSDKHLNIGDFAVTDEHWPFTTHTVDFRFEEDGVFVQIEEFTVELDEEDVKTLLERLKNWLEE